MKAQEFLTEAPKKKAPKVPFTQGPITVLNFGDDGVTPALYMIRNQSYLNPEGLSLTELIAKAQKKKPSKKTATSATAKKSTPQAKKSAPSERTPVAHIDYTAMAQQVVAYMRANAKPWLAQTKNGTLMVYRGIEDDSITAHAFTQNIRQDRRPKDTDKERHIAFNKVIAAAGGVANRSNAAFVSGDKDTAEGYGRAFVFVPLGDFRYTWSPAYADWTQDFETYDLSELAVSTVNYKKDPRAGAYVQQEIAASISYAQQQIKKTKKPDIKAYYEKQAADLQNPKSELYKTYVETLLSAYGEEVQDLVGDEYDPKKARKEIYADRDLVRAIRSGHEIMLNSTTGLYIDDEFYEEAVLPLLQAKPKRESQEITADSLTEGVEDPDIFKAVFLIGGPGSGKTSISQKLLGHSGLRRVDVDAFFTMLKSKENIAGHYEPEFYKRAGALAGRRQDLFLRGRLGMVFDSTGRKTQRILSTKSQLEDLGYDTLLIYVKTDLRSAQARNELRTRKVEPQEVEKMHQEVQQNIDVLKQAFGKNFLVVDNTFVPDLSQASAKVDAFLRLEPQHPAARKWLQGKS